MAQFTLPCLGLAVLALSAQNAIAQADSVIELPLSQVRSALPLDYANTRSIQPKASLVEIDLNTKASSSAAKPGFAAGGVGSGQLLPTEILDAATSARVASTGAEADTRAYGTAGLPFTTSRVDMGGFQLSKIDYFRRAGRLFFKVGADTAICSASLIKPGIVVTAAHCVAEFGTNTGFTNFQYVPAYFQGQAPYGVWTATNVYVLDSYLKGTASCAQPGVVCTNDIAIIKLAPQGGKYAGHYTGWFSYAWNGYGVVSGKTQITQLGYPSSHDGGELMQRTDAGGLVVAEYSNNTVIGSRQTEGSSGGPWLVNFGEAAKFTGTTLGTDGKMNVVVGTTSWGPTDSAIKFMGASPFTSDNIVPLVKAACPTAAAAGCK
ncbi:MAG TPA: trypsin-like serine protease [Thiolinea sp.]|nr:trypsin-like serine protease [Thiolinea sp.]